MTAHDAELALIARDPALPGLGLLLSNERLLAALHTLPAFAHARALKGTYLRYKPGTSCILALEITLAGGESQRCFAKALTRERFAASRAHPKRQALLAAGHPHAPQFLADDAILLQHPTGDRGIRYLDVLWNEKQRAALLRRWLPDLANAPDVEWRFLRYKPERRCVVSIVHAGKPQAVIRCASEHEFGAILQGCATGSALGHVELLGALGEKRLAATCWIEGESLEHLLRDPRMPKLVARAGEALAHVHNAPFTLPARRTTDDDLNQMRRALDTLYTLYPQAVSRFEHCAGRIGQHIRRFEQPAVILHGDFSADQVIVTGPDAPLRIIDWDRSTSGHPLNDMATFLARIEMDVIEGNLSRIQADSARAALLSGYSAHRALPCEGLPWYTALALLALAAEPFRKRDARWPATIDALLQRAEQLTADTTSPGDNDWQERLTQLCQAQHMAQPLQQALGQQMLQSGKVLRHKPGRRALIAYQLAGGNSTLPHAVLGKYREKGTDKHAFACQRALWENGFDGQNAASVPEPLALLPERKMWLQRKADAECLTLRLSPHADLAVTGAAVGTALAALQSNEALRTAVAGKIWRKEDEMNVLERGLAQVAAARPHWRHRLRALLTAGEKLACRLFSAAQTPVHRDFYPDQILTDRRHPARLVLLDFDLCSQSAAALDAGNYLAHVRELALRRFGNADALQAHETAFTGAYLEHAIWTRAEDVRGFLALSLLRHIFLSTRFPGRAHTTVPLLDYCERLTG